ncbi:MULTISPECIES: carbohydrate kinase family protein [unclassified Fusibacter]|uniref:carbohydrate kinase family protein n=1 Tax=unclassified Fusibacter TaxID=2624464 RepID=UPI001012C52C|nr:MULTISPECIES: carbohydrate kinase family protein [unclassified Fusibacter]MCK8058316.1 carbohydrate kinase family protein [Fusibacter sp. A2]NPE20899.1 kinase [Fusibacter sp. A1]RXV63103.1 kinase [Fusibacter sp. A1]
MSKGYVVVFGASVVDIFGFSSNKYRPYNSTPGRVKMSFGGVCRNIAENLARVQVDTRFISVVGNDEKGRSMIEHSELIGYDMSETLVLKNGGTPTYLAILNEKGEMVSAIADMSAIAELNTSFIDEKAQIIRGADYVFVDADSPQNLEYMLDTFSGSTKFILDPVSAEKAISIKHLLGKFHTIKPNRYEAEVLVGFEIESDDDLRRAGDFFLDQGVKNVFISLDSEGIYFTDGVRHLKITAENVSVCNVTGAGDSFVAGLGYGYMSDTDIVTTIKRAMTMSNIAILSDETINPDLSPEFVDRLISETKWLVRDL